MYTSLVIPAFRTLALCAVPVLFLGVGTATSKEAFQQCGKASWYKLGGTTANGERANPQGLTAAHRSLPFGTLVDVTNLANGKTVTVRINDRGPFAKGRVIDVTLAAAKQLGFVNKGITKVRVTGADAKKIAKHTQKCR
ncbi:septal ring lytic transglycosylase RlpA family protein [Labrenzia sp. DG1229]|uniref:septal ring lytic transglycosylase RlpA family protein n=1 Tax=Labrenzia sp. DG1229 TaxID=681847 RepID=UPI00048DF502|nr:septal ring lytic transglycosylase RlpA family protein [Labrenzia sp. DG1229]